MFYLPPMFFEALRKPEFLIDAAGSLLDIATIYACMIGITWGVLVP